MRIYPEPLDIGADEGFSSEKDIFSRAGLAAGMKNLVSTIEHPLVIAFDGVWGSGKTTFLKMWAGELRKAGHPVIFFDAFENDYVEDAFAALARELVELSEKVRTEQNQDENRIKEKAIGLGSLLLRGAFKVGSRAAVRAATAGMVSATDLTEIGRDLESEAQKISEKYIEDFFNKPKEQKAIIDEFRKSLEDLPNLLSEPNSESKPLIFIIDELDRCKPLFALEILERIKHFMTVRNVHFVLGVHLKQLQSSVKFAYGGDIDAVSYLQKFINLTIPNIPDRTTESKYSLTVYAKFLVKKLEIKVDRDSPLQASINTIVRVTERETGSFRTIERALTILALALAFTPENQLRLGAIIGGLVMMKLMRNDLYVNAKQGTLTLSEAKEFLQFPPDPHREENMGWEEQWWTYVLADELPEHLQKFADNTLFRYNIYDRKDIITYTANDVVDRLSLD